MSFTDSFSSNVIGILVLTAFSYGSCLFGQIMGALLLITPFQPSSMRAEPVLFADRMLRNNFGKQLLATLVTSIAALQFTAYPFEWGMAVMCAVGVLCSVIGFILRR